MGGVVTEWQAGYPCPNPPPRSPLTEEEGVSGVWAQHVSSGLLLWQAPPDVAGWRLGDMGHVVHLQGRFIWGQRNVWGPREYPRTTPHPSPPTSRDHPKETADQEPAPLPKEALGSTPVYREM